MDPQCKMVKKNRPGAPGGKNLLSGFYDDGLFLGFG